MADRLLELVEFRVRLAERRPEVGARQPSSRLDRLFDVAQPGCRRLRITAGADARYTGERWLRGDEANETSPLGGYWTADLRAGYALGPWEVQAIVRNVLDRRYDAFGGFNINQGSGGALERFLTPGMPRTVQVVVRRGWGRED